MRMASVVSTTSVNPAARHASHLANRLCGLRHEVQHQQREDAICAAAAAVAGA
jgi:hypothetical protein